MSVMKILITSLTVSGVVFSYGFAEQKANQTPVYVNQSDSKTSALHSAKKHENITNNNSNIKKGTIAKVANIPDKQIYFFMNPNGYPCQMQLAVIDGMKEKLLSKATVKYIKTTVDSDLDEFNKYGIRGLPSLIILDKNGKVLKRFTPGIQDENTILNALNSK